MIGFVFSSAPFGSTSGREGLDAILAASNFCDELAVFFVGDGVMQLLAEQDSSMILSKNHTKTFALLPLCDVEQIYLCQDSLQARGLTNKPLMLEALPLSAEKVAKKMAECRKILRF